MMSSIIENRITRTIIVFLMTGMIIFPVSLFKNTYITSLIISIAMADSTPPYIDHTPVMRWRAGEALQISANIEDESDIKEVWLYYMQGNDSGYTKINMNKVDGEHNQFDAVIPFTEVVGERLLYFIEARDKFGNMSQVGSQSNPFTVKVEGDLPKPKITHMPITRSGVNESIEIKAKIEKQDIIENSTLYYQVGGESEYKHIQMVPEEGNLYQATIPGQNIKSNRVKYYIELVDKFGSKTNTKDKDGDYVIAIEGVINRRLTIGEMIEGWHKKWYVWVLIGVGAIITGIAISNSGGGQGGAGGGAGGGSGG